MTDAERKVRLDVAIGIINDVYTDICRDNSISREECKQKVEDLMYLMFDLRKYSANHLSDTTQTSADLDAVIENCRDKVVEKPIHNDKTGRGLV